MINITVNHDESATCNYCVSRDPAKFRINSTNPSRNLVMYLCVHCADVLSFDLIVNKDK